MEEEDEGDWVLVSSVRSIMTGDASGGVARWSWCCCPVHRDGEDLWCFEWRLWRRMFFRADCVEGLTPDAECLESEGSEKWKVGNC